LASRLLLCCRLSSTSTMAPSSATGFDVRLLSALNLSSPTKTGLGAISKRLRTENAKMRDTFAGHLFRRILDGLSSSALTKATVSPTGFDVRLLSALNMCSPAQNSTCRDTLAKAVDTKKASQTFDKPADAAVVPPLPELGASRRLSLSRSCPDSSEAGESQKKTVSGSDDYTDACPSDTSVGTGSTPFFASEDTDPKTEESESHGESPRFMPMPRFVNNTASKMPLSHEITGVCADQLQQGDYCWPEETPDQRLLKQLAEETQVRAQQQQQQQQKLLLEQRRRRREAFVQKLQPRSEPKIR